jgi:hypothetical protein
MKKIFVFIAFVMMFACKNNENAPAEDKNTIQPTNNPDNSSFNQSFSEIMVDYYDLKNGFINENDSLINRTSRIMMKKVDSLSFNSFHADSSLIEKAQTLAETVSGELTGLLGELTLENKRKSFYTLSEQMYELIKAVHYNREVIYHLNCALAFDRSGATWLSNKVDNKNPYLPNEATNCAEISDKIDFTQK